MDIQTIETNKKPKNVKLVLLYVGMALLIIGTGIGVYAWQHSKVKDTKTQVSSLSAEKESLAKTNKSLEDKNQNLSQATDVLQGQISRDKTTSQPVQGSGSVATLPVPKPATKLTITAVKNVSGTEFAKASYTPPRGDFKAVYATITNQSDKDTWYEIHQFSAITAAGAIVKPVIFSPLETQGLWNNTTLIPSGTQDIVLLFEQNQDIIVLTHASDTGANPVAVSVPKVQ